MLTFFRNFFKTKIGLALALGFLGLIGFAFASMDVSSTGTFGGVAGGDSVAVVGSAKIGTAELNLEANNALRRAREENPEITMQELLEGDGLDQILGGLIDRYALSEWAEDNGFRAGTNLINSEIRQIPAARGASGDFDANAYQMFLRNAQMTDAQLRRQLRTSTFFRQSVLPSVFGVQLPEGVAETYARSFKERRSGAIATIPMSLFAPAGPPSDSELQDFYADNRAMFVRPERRALRYATFDSSALGESIEPTDEEISADYEANSDEYAAREFRSFTQLIVPTREGADAIAARVRGGESFAQAAAAAGLRTATLDSQTQVQVRGSASAAVADAYFAAVEGGITVPAQGPLGWHIARVTEVDQRSAQSLDSVREEIASRLREQKRQRGIAELAVDIEDRLADGASLSAVASELDLVLQTTQPLTAQGLVYGTVQSAPPILVPVLNFAFQIEEGEAEIGALPDQQTFLIYEVTEIIPSAAAPIAQIRERVIEAWRATKANEAAREAAGRIQARVEGGQTLSNAVAAEEIALSSPDQVSYSREEIARLGGVRVPAPIALLFGMAEGSVKRLEGSRDRAWFVVSLDDIALEELAENDPLVGMAQTQIGQAWGSEYAEQMLAAMRAEIGVERNPDAIAAVRRQLLGELN